MVAVITILTVVMLAVTAAYPSIPRNNEASGASQGILKYKNIKKRIKLSKIKDKLLRSNLIE